MSKDGSEDLTENYLFRKGSQQMRKEIDNLIMNKVHKIMDEEMNSYTPGNVHHFRYKAFKKVYNHIKKLEAGDNE